MFPLSYQRCRITCCGQGHSVTPCADGRTPDAMCLQIREKKFCFTTLCLDTLHALQRIGPRATRQRSPSKHGAVQRARLHLSFAVS